MNDLRRLLLWLAVLGILAVGIWGLQWDEEAKARPFAPPYRAFRLGHRAEVMGFVFYVPLGRMVSAWGAILCAVAALYPLATRERSSRWLKFLQRPGPAAPGGRGSP